MFKRAGLVYDGLSVDSPALAAAASSNRDRSSVSLSPIQMARWEWSRSSPAAAATPGSAVLGWTSADSGPRQMASQGTKAPNCAGVSTLTSNMPLGWGPMGLSHTR